MLMPKYEIRVIERTVKVFQVEAEDAAQAEQKLQESEDDELMITSYGIDSEGPFTEEVS